MADESLWDRAAKKIRGMNPFAVAGDAMEGKDVEHSALVEALGARKPAPAGPKPPAPKAAPKQGVERTPEEQAIYDKQQKMLRGR
jgi:hypothetical protein